MCRLSLLVMKTLNDGEVFPPYLATTSVHNSILGECRYEMAVVNRLEKYSYTEGEFEIQYRREILCHSYTSRVSW